MHLWCEEPPRRARATAAPTRQTGRATSLVRRKLGSLVSGLPAGGGREVCRVDGTRDSLSDDSQRRGTVFGLVQYELDYVARTTNPCPKTIYVPLNRQRHHPFFAPAFILAGRQSGGQTGGYRLSTQRRYRLARRLLRGSPVPAYLPGGKIEKIESPTLLFDFGPGTPARTSEVPP